MTIFNTDGKIEPIKFRFDDKVVRIEKIIKTYEEKNSWKQTACFCLSTQW